MYITKIGRAIANQWRYLPLEVLTAASVAWLLMLGWSIFAIVSSSDKDGPVAILGCLALYSLILGWCGVKYLLSQQEQDDDARALAERKAAYRARLDMNSTLSEADKRRLLRTAFICYEPLYI